MKDLTLNEQHELMRQGWRTEDGFLVDGYALAKQLCDAGIISNPYLVSNTPVGSKIESDEKNYTRLS